MGDSRIRRTGSCFSKRSTQDGASQTNMQLDECGTQTQTAGVAWVADDACGASPIAQAVSFLKPYLAGDMQVASEDRLALQELILAACEAGSRLLGLPPDDGLEVSSDLAQGLAESQGHAGAPSELEPSM